MKIKVLEAGRKLEEQMNGNNESNNKLIPSDLKKNPDATLKKNSKVIQRNLIVQDKIDGLEKPCSRIE